MHIIRTECEAEMQNELYVLTLFVVGYTLSYLARAFSFPLRIYMTQKWAPNQSPTH